MPRYYRRSYRGRRYYRRRRPLMAMKVYQSPATSFRKMTYDCDKFISPGYNIGKVPNVHNIFRATSVYDPDYSIGGTSAVGYASAAEGFNHYTVMAARITTFWSPYSISASSYQMGTANEGAGIPIWAGVGLVADQSALTQDYTLLSKTTCGTGTALYCSQQPSCKEAPPEENTTSKQNGSVLNISSTAQILVQTSV